MGCLRTYLQVPHLEILKSPKLTPDLRTSKLVSLSIRIQYPLDSDSKWPLNGTLDPIILRDCHTHCQRSGKRKEVVHAQAFTYLLSRPLPSSCASYRSLQFPCIDWHPPLSLRSPALRPQPNPQVPQRHLTQHRPSFKGGCWGRWPCQSTCSFHAE